MPQRSNLFQRLALIVHETLEPDWTVTESAMLKDSITGHPREVDIVATKRVASHELVLSIECRDHSRAADVQWIESAAKKHEHLPTSKLVLWSRSGFTKQAELKARALKIDTVSQAKATSPTWARLARSLIGGSVEHVSPRYEPFVDLILPDGTLERFESVDKWTFFNADGALVGSMAALIQNIAQNATTGKTLLDHAPTGEGTFWAQLKPPEPWYADNPSGIRCQTHRIGVGISTLKEKAPLETASALSDKKVITLAAAALQSGTLEFVIEESESGTATVRSRQGTKEA